MISLEASVKQMWIHPAKFYDVSLLDDIGVFLAIHLVRYSNYALTFLAPTF